MTKRVIVAGMVLLSFLVTAIAFGQEDIKKHPSCKYCGMNREQFAHSRVYIEYEDGSTEGTCSVHCAAIDFVLNIDKIPKAIRVGNYNTKQLIDVENATWIIGGNKMGVMTKRAKWAFAKKEDAEKFKMENGGELVTYDQVIKAVYEDMYQDTKMIQERRKMRKMQQKP